jgi:hypothetical protein
LSYLVRIASESFSEDDEITSSRSGNSSSSEVDSDDEEEEVEEEGRLKNSHLFIRVYKLMKY